MTAAALACFLPLPGQYSPREVGGGRATRQPGQVRKEAALTSAVRVARQPPTPYFRIARILKPAPFATPQAGGGVLKNNERRRKRKTRFLPRAGAQIPALDLRRPDRPGRHGAHGVERLRGRPHPAGLDPHRRARRRQDHDGAHFGARAQLRIARRLDHRPDHQDAGARRALPGDHGFAPSRRHRDGRGVPQRRRRRARDQRRGALRAGLGALQGLYPRRSAHALRRRLQRAVEDAGRAAGPRQVHFRHHRNPQSSDHRAVALPAF